MSSEIQTKKKWPYLWYDPQTGLPFDFKPENTPLKSPTSTRTSRLREEMLKKASEEQAEPFPRHVLTAPSTVSAGTTKTQRLREMLASKTLEDQQRRNTMHKTAFKARTPPSSTREDMQLQPHKTTNSQRLREEHCRKVLDKHNEDTMAAFMESHRRMMSATMEIFPQKTDRIATETNIRKQDQKKNTVSPVTEKKSKTNPRPIEGSAKRKTSALKLQNAPPPSSASHNPSQTNLARARYSSEPKLNQKVKNSANNRNPNRKQDSSSTSTTGRRSQSSVSVEKVNKAISKNRVNFLKEKMKRMTINDSHDANKSSYTEECLKVLNQSKTAAEESKKASDVTDKSFKVIMPAKKRMYQPDSPSKRIRDFVQDALSTTDEGDTSDSEA